MSLLEKEQFRVQIVQHHIENEKGDAEECVQPLALFTTATMSLPEAFYRRLHEIQNISEACGLHLQSAHILTADGFRF